MRCNPFGIPEDAKLTLRLLRYLHRENLDRFFGDVGVAASSGCCNLSDGINDIRSFCDPAKDTITDSILRRLFVEEEVVFRVDKELARRAIGNAGSSHRNRVLEIAQTVARFVFDRATSLLLSHVRGETSPLDHESIDYPVENRSVVVSVFRIRQKILDGDGSRFRIQFEGDVSHIGF